jgi:hypothetical protein
VDVVGSLHAFARVVEHSLRNVDFDAQPSESRTSRAPQVVRGEVCDAVFLEPLQASGDAAGDVLRIDWRRLFGARKYLPRAARHDLKLLEFLDRPTRQRHDMPLAGFRMRVRNRPGPSFEVELAPLGERELAAALESEQEHAKDVRKPLKAAGVIEILKKGLQLLLGQSPRSRSFLPAGARRVSLTRPLSIEALVAMRAALRRRQLPLPLWGPTPKNLFST